MLSRNSNMDIIRTLIYISTLEFLYFYISKSYAFKEFIFIFGSYPRTQCRENMRAYTKKYKLCPGFDESKMCTKN